MSTDIRYVACFAKSGAPCPSDGRVFRRVTDLMDCIQGLDLEPETHLKLCTVPVDGRGVADWNEMKQKQDIYAGFPEMSDLLNALNKVVSDDS